MPAAAIGMRILRTNTTKQRLPFILNSDSNIIGWFCSCKFWRFALPLTQNDNDDDDNDDDFENEKKNDYVNKLNLLNGNIENDAKQSVIEYKRKMDRTHTYSIHFPVRKCKIAHLTKDTTQITRRKKNMSNESKWNYVNKIQFVNETNTRMEY